MTDFLASADTFHAKPLTDRCQGALAGRVHACLGVSPFNSHFSASHIAALARWATTTFGAVHFFVPDTAAAYTLEALGHPPHKAAWKARRQGQYVKNKIRRGLLAAGVTEPEGCLLDGEALATNSFYGKLREQVEQHYLGDPAFARACLEATAWTLERRLPDGRQPTSEQLSCAVRYFLAELPLFLDTPRIAGVSSSVFCYHQVPAFLDDLFHSRLALRPESGQGYVQLTDLRQ